MNTEISLNEVEETMLRKLKRSEGLFCSDQEYAQRFFSRALWIEYHLYFKSQEENENEKGLSNSKRSC